MLEEIPIDIFQFILSYFHNINDLYALSLTSKGLYKLCDKENLWNIIYKETLSYKYYRIEREGYQIKSIDRSIVNDKYSTCILMIENNHEIVFDVYSFLFSSVENKYSSQNHYTIKPGYNIQIDTYIDSVWFIAPTKESYFTDGYLEQSRVIRVWENPLSSRLIDRVLIGNNWSHRLYYIPLLIPERSVFIPNIHRNIYTLKKTHF